MASLSPSPMDEDASLVHPTPFLVKLFYRTSAFHRPDEFAAPSLPPYVPVYTWKTCTLTDLTDHLAAATPPVLPDVSIGCRLVFRLLFVDPRGHDDRPPRYIAKDIGSVVIGVGGPGVAASADVDDDDNYRMDTGAAEADAATDANDGTKTLNDARFVVGDYISCTILPPDSHTGDVAPRPGPRTGGRGAGVGAGDGRSTIGVAPPPQRDQISWGSRPRRSNTDHSSTHYSGGGHYPRSPRNDRGGRASDARGLERGGFPEGEWRRGERIPSRGSRMPR
ncbi:Sin3 associated polypeptide p18-domain-containing protein [Lasiosphaeria hispida]|uniref:Sin3 associated polypeptide p18-domain-containing protein n=1 Tax=Lasiosphaeria hispida TaxID=260671 RepID=A0AAJ0MG38_9PEZI|nr:Sin3 associated polypeptide p18-domain-containing protein [Lasiosphaeria hispida]